MIGKNCIKLIELSVIFAMGLDEFLEQAELVSKIILIIVSIVGGAILHYKAIKLEKSGQKYFFLGIAIFGYVFAVTRALFLYTDHIGSGNPSYDFLWRLAWVMSLVSITAIVIVIETYIMKTKYIFTIIAFIGIGLTIFLAISDVRYINAAVSAILLVDILAAYTYVAVKSEGELRNRALKSFLGISLVAIGLVIDGFSDQLFGGMDLSVIGASLMIIGLILYIKTIHES